MALQSAWDWLAIHVYGSDDEEADGYRCLDS
jgi:hypothetical protein